MLVRRAPVPLLCNAKILVDAPNCSTSPSRASTYFRAGNGALFSRDPCDDAQSATYNKPSVDRWKQACTRLMDGVRGGTCTASAARPTRQRAAVNGISSTGTPSLITSSTKGASVAASPAAQSGMGGPPSAALSAARRAQARCFVALCTTAQWAQPSAAVMA